MHPFHLSYHLGQAQLAGHVAVAKLLREEFHDATLGSAEGVGLVGQGLTLFAGSLAGV